MKEQASEGTSVKRVHGVIHDPVVLEKTRGDFSFSGGSFVHEPCEPSGRLDAPVAPGLPRVPYWPCSSTVQQNTHAKYVSKF